MMPLDMGFQVEFHVNFQHLEGLLAVFPIPNDPVEVRREESGGSGYLPATVNSVCQQEV
jgi:hypothetical protein